MIHNKEEDKHMRGVQLTYLVAQLNPQMENLTVEVEFFR